MQLYSFLQLVWHFFASSGVDILRKEVPFGKGIFGVLQGRIFGFWWEKQRFKDKQQIKQKMCGLSGRTYCYLHIKNVSFPDEAIWGINFFSAQVNSFLYYEWPKTTTTFLDEEPWRWVKNVNKTSIFIFSDMLCCM